MIGPPGPGAATTTMLNSSSSGFPQRCRASTVENRPESLESLEKGAHQVVEIRLPLSKLLDLPDRVDHRRVVFAAKAAANLGQRGMGQRLAQVHRDLPGRRDRFGVVPR